MKNFIDGLFAFPLQDRVFGLDLLRAFAILAVLLTHGSLLYPFDQNGWFTVIASAAGHLGVELFFVLSGFLIGSILLSQEPNFHQIKILPAFWQRRWFRTIPNYLFFLLLYVLAAFLLSKPLPSILSYITFTQNWLWPHPGFFDQAWSLAIEEWFYLLFPLCLFVLNRVLKSFDGAFLISALIFIILPSVIRITWALQKIPDWNANFRSIMFIRLDAIMYGVLAAWVKKRFFTFWKNQRLPFLAAGLVILFINWQITFNQSLDESFFAKTFFFSFTSLGFACMLPVTDQWKSARKSILTGSIQWIALWSYSLYLCNFLIAQVLSNILDYTGRASDFFNITIFASFFAISLILSFLVYTFLEKPMMDLGRRLSKTD